MVVDFLRELFIFVDQELTLQWLWKGRFAFRYNECT